MKMVSHILLTSVFVAYCHCAVAGPQEDGVYQTDADRKAQAQARERKRIEAYDKPIKPDPVGNALVGGAVAGAVTGATQGAAAAASAGAASIVRGTAIGVGVEKAKANK